MSVGNGIEHVRPQNRILYKISPLGSNSQVWNRESRSRNKDLYVYMFSKLSVSYALSDNYGFVNGFEGPGGLKQMWETCNFHPALIVGQNSFMVPIRNVF